MQKYFFVIYLFLSYNVIVSGQFEKNERELAYYADVMLNAQKAEHRTLAAENFNELFYKTLEMEGSYSYPFDSIIWISQKTPNDRSFRIFTWIVDEGAGKFSHKGLIQIASGKVFLLNDKLNQNDDWEFFTSDKDDWMGAMYYHLMEDEFKGVKHYLLFGFHRYDDLENIKIADVLYFDKNGEPFFGKEIFLKKGKDERDIIKSRLVLKYSADSYVGLHYNESMGMIIHDYLIPNISMGNNERMALISDGSLAGYEKKNDFWVYVDKIYTQILDEARKA
jgi:hypothetical protein